MALFRVNHAKFFVFIMPYLNCWAEIDFGLTTAKHIADKIVLQETHTNLTTNEHTGTGNPYLLPAEGEHTATLIFLHDFGESGHWWRDELKKIRLPCMSVICPQSSIRYRRNSSGGPDILSPSWFFFKTQHYKEEGVHADPAGVGNSTFYMNFLITREMKWNHIRPDRIFIGGVSQGAVIALHSGLCMPKRLGGILALSPWKMNTTMLDKSFHPNNTDIPIFQSYMASEYTPIDSAKSLSEELKKYSQNVQFKEYTGKRALSNEQSCKDITDFFKTHLGES